MNNYIYGHWNSSNELQPSHVAFTYKLWFPEINKRYIGLKFIKGVNNQKHYWKNYNTSSQYVKDLLEEGHKCHFTIVEFFDDHQSAIDAEINALRAYDIMNRKEYLNKSINGAILVDDEVRLKMSTSRTGKTLSAETRAKLSDVAKGRTHTTKTRAKMSAANKGKTLSAETRAKMSKSHKGKTLSAETRAKLSAANKGKTHKNRHSDETRAKLSESKKGKNNPSWKGYIHTPFGVFETPTEAAAFIQCSINVIRYRCNDPKYTEYYYKKEAIYDSR